MKGSYDASAWHQSVVAASSVKIESLDFETILASAVSRIIDKANKTGRNISPASNILIETENFSGQYWYWYWFWYRYRYWYRLRCRPTVVRIRSRPPKLLISARTDESLEANSWLNFGLSYQNSHSFDQSSASLEPIQTRIIVVFPETDKRGSLMQPEIRQQYELRMCYKNMLQPKKTWTTLLTKLGKGNVYRDKF